MRPSSGIHRALVGAVWLSATGYLAFAMNFGLTLLLARLLFPKDFGQFALAGSIAELLSLVTGFAFSQGIIQMQDEPAITETAYVLSWRLYGALLLFGAALAALLSTHYPGSFVPLFFALFAVRNLNLILYIYSAQLEKGFLYNQLSVIRLTSTVVSIIVALGLAQAGGGVWSLLGREAALSLVMLAGCRIASGWRYHRGGFHAETARKLWRFGWLMFVNRALETVWYRGDTAILGVLAGTLTLGFYDRGRYLAEFGHYIVSFAAVQVAFPVYARLQGRPEALTYAYRLSHDLLIRLMFPLLIWLALFPQELVGLLYGAGVRWSETATILPWLAVFGFLFPVGESMKVLFVGIGRLGDALRIRLIQVIIALPLLVPAVWLGGARGAASVMVLSEIGGLITGYRALRTRVSGLSVHSYVKPAVAAALAGGVIAIGRNLHLLPWSGRLGYAANLGSVGSLYVLFLLILDWRQIQAHLAGLSDGFRGAAPLGWRGAPAENVMPATTRPADVQREWPVSLLPKNPP